MTTPANDGPDRPVTKERFASAVRTSAPLVFASLVTGLAETERKKLSKTAQELMKQARPTERENFGWPTHEGHMARLALLAVAPKSQVCRGMSLSWAPRNVRNMSFRVTPGPNKYEEAAYFILADRQPDWAGDWLQCQISQQNGSLGWEIIRRLIREGVCSKPESPEYLQLLAGFGRTANFELEPDILEDVWKLFQVPTNAFGYITHLKREDLAKAADSQYSTWPQIFYQLMQENRIDRGRLIDELVGALWREHSSSERAGFVHFHTLLEPTDEELIRRQSAYVELLRNPTPSNVTFTLKILKALAKQQEFDAAAALAALPAVFEITSKTQPKSALTLLKTIVRKHPGLETEAVEVAVRGLTHPESDVQEAALKLLEGWKPESLPAGRLLEVRELVSPVVKPRLDDLLGELTDEPVTADEDGEAQAIASDISIGELRERSERLSAELRTAWKLDEAWAACEAGEVPPPPDIDRSPGVLGGLNEVAPIADAEELIDAVGRALESIDSPLEIERILDGLSRLGLERPDDFEARTAALRQRLQQADTQMLTESLLFARWLLPPLIELLGIWLRTGSGSRRGWLQSLIGRSANQMIPIHEVLCVRPNLIQSRLIVKTCGPLLSFPTHDHGWIDPRVFVERLKEAESSGLGIDRRDFRFGLLRLAPDFRAEAIRAARELPDPFGRIVRYALGDNVQPARSDRKWKEDWLAAGRARSPRGTLSELECLKLPVAANVIFPAAYRVRLDQVPTDSDRYMYHFHSRQDPYVELESPGQTTLNPEEYPAQVISHRMSQKKDHQSMWGMFSWLEPWLASLWPSNPEPSLACAIQSLLVRLDSTASSWEPVAGMLLPLLRAERDWSPSARYAIWLAMFSRDNDAKAVAVDALVEGLLDGRAQPEPLAETLVDVARYQWVKLNRLAESLRQVTGISDWGTLVLSQILDRLMASWETPPRDAHRILEIQLELLMDLDGSLSDAARRPLEPLTGSSKTARLGKQLLKLEGSRTSARYRSALLAGAEVRLNRAEQTEQSLRVGASLPG